MEKACIKCDVVKPETTEFFRFRTDTKKFRNTCLTCEAERTKELYEQNREFHINKSKKYYHNVGKHNPANKQKKAEWFQKNKKKVVAQQQEYKRNRKKVDPFFKMKTQICKTISNSFIRKNFTKNSKTGIMLGCDWHFFKTYIEGKFTEGMNWGNQGEWEFDHIIPVSLAKNEEELIKLNHYTNFQPLWAEENREKGNKLLP